MALPLPTSLRLSVKRKQPWRKTIDVCQFNRAWFFSPPPLPALRLPRKSLSTNPIKPLWCEWTKKDTLEFESHPAQLNRIRPTSELYEHLWTEPEPSDQDGFTTSLSRSYRVFLHRTAAENTPSRRHRGSPELGGRAAVCGRSGLHRTLGILHVPSGLLWIQIRSNTPCPCPQGICLLVPTEALCLTVYCGLLVVCTCVAWVCV